VRETLRVEVTEYLRAHSARTTPEIAMGIRARHVDVKEILAGDGFEQVPHPEGASPRGIYFMASLPVLPSRRGSLSPSTDLGFLLQVLSDGRWHSLTEILARSFADRGHGLTVHSRVSQLRSDHGFTVEQRFTTDGRRRGSEYRLVRDLMEEAA
jgi:hypothetical protein